MPDQPLFFAHGDFAEGRTITLDPDTAKHIWQVLRMQAGDKLLLTNGKGMRASGIIQSADRSKCTVTITRSELVLRTRPMFHLAVALTKNNSRNEWLLEKATELGVASIIALQTARTEKSHFRADRWDKILQSAILQSRQYHMPVLTEQLPLPLVLQQYQHIPKRFIAHCLADDIRQPLHKMLNPAVESIILIGPEGDFTPEEVNLCMQHGYQPVSLGNTRLRTETAAITAAAYCNVMTDGEV